MKMPEMSLHSHLFEFILFISVCFFLQQSLRKHNKSFHKLFLEIPEEETVTHGEPRCSAAQSWRSLFSLFPLFVCSLQLFPAQGGPVPRKALRFRELSLLLLVGAAERHEGTGHVSQLLG